MKKIYYHKLIRDKVPSNIEANGSQLSCRILGKSEFRRELLKKVGEEAGGLLAAQDKEELIRELADVVDVIDEIKRTEKITTKQIVTAQKKNALKKGGFKKRIFLQWSSDDGYKTNERKYKK